MDEKGAAPMRDVWYTVSTHHPDEKFFVKKSLNEISPHMAPSQIAEAERLALIN
jgi:hypothetical protein